MSKKTAQPKLLKNPYGFDRFKEFKIYLSVGDKEGIKEGYLYYSDWKKHIQNDCLESMFNRAPNVNKAECLENFSRYLRQKQMPYKMFKDLSISVIAPIEIALVTVFATIEYFGNMWETEISLYLIGIALMIIIILAHGYGTLHANYYSDVLEIVRGELEKEQCEKRHPLTG